MTLKAALVLTTVGDPVLLDGYFENFRANGRLAQVRVIVIPDRQTPKAAYDRCAQLAKKGLSVICPTLEEQECFLRKLGLPADFIPYNSDNRRNIGYLIALEGECDFIDFDRRRQLCADARRLFRRARGRLWRDA